MRCPRIGVKFEPWVDQPMEEPCRCDCMVRQAWLIMWKPSELAADCLVEVQGDGVTGGEGHGTETALGAVTLARCTPSAGKVIIGNKHDSWEGTSLDILFGHGLCLNITKNGPLSI